MKKNIIFHAFLALTLVASFPHSSSHVFAQEQAQSNKIVRAIDIRGNKTISIPAIMSRIKTRVGQEYFQNLISDDLKRLYNTGFFSDVKVDREEVANGIKVVFYLMEKPLIEELSFSKTRRYRSKHFLTKMKTQENKFLDRKMLNDDINTIKEMYAKKGMTQASVDVETFVDEATNKASLHFIIREGDRVRIKRINVVGNLAFSDKRLIKVMKSRPHWWLNSGHLKEDVLDEDLERLQSFYEKNGYIDMRVNYDVDKLTKGFVNVNVNIEEGQRYFIGDVDLTGNTIASESEVLSQLKYARPGEVFSRQLLSQDLGEVRNFYFDKGYIFARTDQSTSLNPETGRVDILLNVEEGGIAYINKIKIQGNTTTRDIVIRRELRMFPGDQFDGFKLRRSRERLSNLGYFEDIAFDMEDTNYDDRKDLLVKVKESKTGSFSFGGGYSTVDELVGFIEVEQRNFDFTNWPNFTGGGQRLALRAEAGSTRTDFRLSFTEPWLFDKPVSFGFDLFNTERDREQNTGYAFDEERLGGKLRLGKQLSEYLSIGGFYRIEEVDISNFQTNVSSALLAEAGESTLSSTGFSITKDMRDSTISPTKGWVATGTTELAGGIFGGDKDFYRIEGTGKYYVPLKWDSVLEFRLRAGFIQDYDDSESVPIFERYFAGGARSIRGYEERQVGPLDAVTSDPIGGESLLVGNIEYTIPIVEFIKFATFIDIGNVWAEADDFASDELLAGTGVGLRVKTPIGPVKLDLGYPLDDEPGEDKKSTKFYFSVSRGF